MSLNGPLNQIELAVNNLPPDDDTLRGRLESVLEAADELVSTHQATVSALLRIFADTLQAWSAEAHAGDDHAAADTLAWAAGQVRP